VIINGRTRKIIAVHTGKGREHDFAVYKRTVGSYMNGETLLYADLGYMGIDAFHAKSKIPIKAKKNQELSEKDKLYNKRLSKKRIHIEHINAKIKTFKIMSYPYRNHRKRHLLRLSLICSVINLELKQTSRKTI
jgi:hypothetical protein